MTLVDHVMKLKRDCLRYIFLLLFFTMTLTGFGVSGEIVEKGTLESTSQTPVYSSASGVIKWIVSESTWVKKGDPLVELDLEGLEADVKSSKEAIEDKRTEVHNTRQLLTSKGEEQQMSLGLYQKEWEYAKFSLAALKKGVKSDELELSSIKVELAKIDLERAKEALARQENLVNKEFASKSSLESLAMRVKSREVRVADVERQHAQLMEPPDLEETLEQEALVRRWEGRVKRAELKHRRELASIELELLKQEEELRKMIFELQEKENDLKDTKIYSPTEGLVLLAQKRDWSRGGNYVPIFVGTSVHERDVLVHVIDPSNTQVSLTVHENNIDQMVLGTVVECRVPALNHEIFMGKVLDVSALGSDLRDLLPIGEIDDEHGQTYFRVLIRLNQQDERFMPGMSAIVSIPNLQ